MAKLVYQSILTGYYIRGYVDDVGIECPEFNLSDIRRFMDGDPD